jgi:hypothetical protein
MTDLPLLLTDPLPLRRSTELPRYRTDTLLPWCYGRVTIAPVPLDDAGLEWLLADHAIAGVERVTVAGKAIDGWQLVQRLDATGHPIATLRLTQPPKDGAPLAAAIAGRLHPLTGAVLEHPADIAADLLGAAGWSVPVDAFQGLRDDYPALTLGIVFNQAGTLRQALAAVIEPLGAVWTASPLMARRAGGGAPVAVLDVASLDSIDAASDSTTLATVARITYARDDSDGRARAALTLAAPAAIERHGRIVVDIDLPAVRTGRDALAIGTARLQDMARPRWSINATLQARGQAWALGDTVTLNHPHAPQGEAMITSLSTGHGAASIALTLTCSAGTPPPIETLSHASAIDKAEAVQQTLYKDGVATFTVSDDAGNPLAGASVTLDGIDTRTTDRLGQVQFKTERGPHTLTVYLAGYATFELDVIV